MAAIILVLGAVNKSVPGVPLVIWEWRESVYAVLGKDSGGWVD